MRKLTILLGIISFVYGCTEKNKEKTADPLCIVDPNIEDSEFDGWWLKDFETDSIPGISLERAHKELINDDEGEEVIVAIIDSPIDIVHEDLRCQIYTNPDEIPGNNKDDDNNGYVDDIHGWNYLGYGSNQMERFGNYDYTRIYRRLSPMFKDIDSTNIQENQKEDYKKYLKAVELMEGDITDVENELAFRKEERASFDECVKLFPHAFDSENKIFIEAVTDTIKPKTDRQKELLEVVQDFAYYGFYPEYLDDDLNGAIYKQEHIIKPDYDGRARIGDDIYVLNQIKGNGNVQAQPGTISHGTQVAGAIAATRNNKIGVKGISNKIKLMILGVFPKRGDELDKDVANAIRYAVDNGAKVINYSHGRYLVDKEDYLWDALRYAESKGVILVSAAGNDPKDLDVPEDNPYPMDNDINNNEVISNMVKVGASGRKPSRIKPYWSSHGKNNVDLFAPGQRITTTQSGTHKYFELGGSSLSTALVTGTIALLYSQYPELTYKQVKEIILTSGTKFDVELELNDDSFAKFDDLSKSGTVLNVYQALKKAEELTSGDTK